MISRMRVLSSPANWRECREERANAYRHLLRANKTIRELDDLMKSERGIDPLKLGSQMV